MKPTIIPFRCHKVDHSWLGRTSRYALSRLTGGTDVETDDEPILKTMQALVLRRRRLITALRRAGYKRLGNDRFAVASAAKNTARGLLLVVATHLIRMTAMSLFS
jgi:hypothetical protein